MSYIAQFERDLLGSKPYLIERPELNEERVNCASCGAVLGEGDLHTGYEYSVCLECWLLENQVN